MNPIRVIQTSIISVAIIFAGVVVFNGYNSSFSDLTTIANDSNGSDNRSEDNLQIIEKNSNTPSIAEAKDTTNPDSSDNIIESKENIIIINGEITSGDSFDSSLRRNKVPANIRQQIITALQGHLDFKRLSPNDKYIICLSEDNSLIRCSFDAGPLESYLLTVDDGKITVTQDSINLKSQTVKISGEIKNSLFSAFAKINESAKLVYAFADIFSSRIDFNTETQPGDSFTLLVDKYYKGDKFVGYGKISTAEYNRVNGKPIVGYYFSSEEVNGTYFDQYGQEVGTSFIRSPVPMARVTSRFTYRRKHPITGKVQPHLGIDLAAPLGTPILAAGDGKIKFIGRKGANGRQIIISHYGGYQTLYGHLARFKKGLKKGSFVNKKDIIGYVGSSGLSTGPHLDYRIKHNGVYKNPFSIEFKPKSKLKGQSLANLNLQIKEIRAAMDAVQDYPNTILQVETITLVPQQKLILL